MVEFDEVSTRIKSHSGEVFRQIRGGQFTYIAHEGYVEPDPIGLRRFSGVTSTDMIADTDRFFVHNRDGA